MNRHTHTRSHSPCASTQAHTCPRGPHADSQTHTCTRCPVLYKLVYPRRSLTHARLRTLADTRTGQTARHTHVHNCTNSLPRECPRTHTHPCSSLQEPRGGRNQQGHAGPFSAEPASPRARPLLSAAGSTPTWSGFLGAEGSPPVAVLSYPTAHARRDLRTGALQLSVGPTLPHANESSGKSKAGHQEPPSH